MKTIPFLACAWCIAIVSAAQSKKETFYLFRSDWNPAKSINDAAYFMQVVKDNDSAYVCRYYQKNGPMVRQETYRDKDMDIPNGLFVWYDANGNADSIGHVLNKRKDGDWRYYHSGVPVATIHYDNGKPLKTNNFNGAVGGNNSEETREVKISVAEFRNGGIPGWIKFIQKNLNTPDRFKSVMLQKNLNTGKVMVSFNVNTEGMIDDIVIEQSCEWSADMEVIRMLRSSPPWMPATQNGEKVNFRHRQLLSFNIMSR